MWAGQPPMATRSANWKMGSGAVRPCCGSPSSRPRSEMLPVEWPASKSDIGRIRSRVNRPAPVWRCDVVRRHRRTGQDELPAGRTLVHAASNVVPDVWRQLPLVQQSGHLPCEDGRRIDARHPLRVEVDVEKHVAGARLYRRRRLTDRPSAPPRGQRRTHPADRRVRHPRHADDRWNVAWAMPQSSAVRPRIATPRGTFGDL